MAEPMKKTVNSAAEKQPVLTSVTPPSTSSVDPNKMDPAEQAYHLLRFTFAVVPIVAGFDKFWNNLVNWETYLSPVIPNVFGYAPQPFMHLVGVIEIIAGIGVVLKPRLFGYVVAAWLFLIVINLLMLGNYFDIAFRDIALCLAALAFGRLSAAFDVSQVRFRH